MFSVKLQSPACSSNKIQKLRELISVPVLIDFARVPQDDV